MNQWNLSKREEETVDLLCLLGDQGSAAQKMGIRHETYRKNLVNVRRKMGVDNTILAVLKWDREVMGRDL